GPIVVARRLIELFATPEFLWNAFASSWRVLVSIAAALLIGGGVAFFAPCGALLAGGGGCRVKPVPHSFSSLCLAIFVAVLVQPRRFRRHLRRGRHPHPVLPDQHRGGAAQYRSRAHGDGAELHAAPGARSLASDLAAARALRTFRDPDRLWDRLEDCLGRGVA